MQSRHRIMFVIRNYPPDRVGGAARSTQNLAEALQARGHDVHIVRLAPAGQLEKARQEAVDAGLLVPGKPQIHFLPMRNIYWPYDLKPRKTAVKTLWHFLDLHNVWAARDFRKLLAKVKPDVVNTSVIDGFSTAIFGAVKASGAALVHTMRDYYLVCTRSGMFQHGKNCTQLCGTCQVSATARRIDAHHVDLFLSNSEFVAQTHVKYGAIQPRQPHLVQFNINEREMAAAPHRIAGDKIVFGFIGRIVPTKGLEKLLEAASRLAPEGRDWELHIAGAGEERFAQALIDQYGSNPHIKFLGWADPGDFYGAIDVLVCPSTYNEPLPRVVYEAYGFAVPAIAASTGGIPEVVKDGVTGLLYGGEDIDGLTAHLETFRAMPEAAYEAFSAAALALGRQFATDVVVETYEGRIDAVVSGLKR
jgi:glycosyltransferase involved in cell wall biosynthesis